MSAPESERRYTPCKCGLTQSDLDYEVVVDFAPEPGPNKCAPYVRCRLCGRTIGEVQ